MVVFFVKIQAEKTKTRSDSPKHQIRMNTQQLSAAAHCPQLLKRTRVWSFAYTGKGGAYHAVSACAFCTMATRTLNLPGLLYGYLLVFLLISNQIYCQQFSISFLKPSDCGVQAYFDISNLTCVKCGPNQVRSKSGNTS